jgi:adenylate cyclase, class 2
MGNEIETQILEINKEEIIKKLRKLNAVEEKEILQKRWVFDIKCLGSTNPGLGEWVRLRKESNKTTLTYKNKRGTGISETEEIEIIVDDFDKTAQLLSKLTCFEGQYYQENKRHKFVLNGIEFTIDSWPKIPVFLEIEAKSEEKLKEGLKLLDLEGKDVGHWGLLKIYNEYGIDLHSFKEIRF